MQIKSVLVILSLIFIFSGAHAITLQEKSLSTYFFSGIDITTAEASQCQSFTFTPFENYQDQGNDTLLNLGIQFFPAEDFDSNVTVAIGGNRIQTIYSRDFTPAHAHVEIPAEMQNENGTLVTVCANASPTLQRLTVSSTGTLGVYQQPHFDGPSDFETYVVTPQRILGQEIEVQVRLHNSGSIPSDVHVDYRKFDVPFLPLLKGETGFDVTLQPDEQKTITYYIKPLRAVELSLPPAVLTYTNIFEEEVTVESNRAYVHVREPQFNVKGVFVVNQTHALVNEPVDVRWLAQNDGLDPLYGLNAEFTVTPAIATPISSTPIAVLPPSKDESKNFTITFTEPGTYTLGCTIYQSANPELRTNCQGTTITITEDTRIITMLLSLLLVIIGIGVYAYIYYSKPRQHTETKPRKRFQA